MKLAANLTWMFQEISADLLVRCELASTAGFKAVEFPVPYQVDKEVLSEKLRQLGLKQVLINSPSGESRGFACHPAMKEEFRQSIQAAIDYAKVLKCERIHVLAGLIPAEFKFADCEDTYVSNLSYAAKQCEMFGITAVIEPINSWSIPNYFLSSYDKALDYIRGVGQSNLKLMLDVFHLQIISGNLTNQIKRLLPFTGHIQIAQVPDRHEPNSCGEINYQYVFSLISQTGYGGYVGLEYIPAGSTVEGLAWAGQFGLPLD